MNWQTKKADFQFLVDSGLLFEINRQILNPFGLALVLKKLPDGTITLAECLKDFRSEPEKILLDPASFENGKRKLKEFLEEYGYGQIERRRSLLGFGTQDHAEQFLRRPKCG